MFSHNAYLNSSWNLGRCGLEPGKGWNINNLVTTPCWNLEKQSALKTSVRRQLASTPRLEIRKTWDRAIYLREERLIGTQHITACQAGHCSGRFSLSKPTESGSYEEKFRKHSLKPLLFIFYNIMYTYYYVQRSFIYIFSFSFLNSPTEAWKN